MINVFGELQTIKNRWRLLLVIASFCLFLSCNNKITEFNLNENKISAALEVYKQEDNYKAVIHLKNTAAETKNIILIGEVRDSVREYNADIIFEIIQNKNHLYSYQTRFKNIVVSEMMPTKYTLEKDSVQAIFLDYIGDLRSDFNLDVGGFKIRALIIPSGVNSDLYHQHNKEAVGINNFILDTIKTQFLKIE